VVLAEKGYLSNNLVFVKKQYKSCFLKNSIKVSSDFQSGTINIFKISDDV